MLNLRDKIQNLQNTHILVDNMYEISILSSVSTYSWVGWTPPDFAWSGGDFNFSGTHAWKAEVPHTRNFELGGTSSISLGGFTLARPSRTKDILQDSFVHRARGQGHVICSMFSQLIKSLYTLFYTLY